MAVVFPIGKAITEGVIVYIIFIIHFPFPNYEDFVDLSKKNIRNFRIF